MKDTQKKVKEFVKRHNLEAKAEFRALDMMSELGEIAKELLINSKYGKSECLASEELKLEIADLLFSLICIANTYDIDLNDALDKVIQGYEERINSNKLKGVEK